MSKIKSFVVSCATLLATIIGVASPSAVQAANLARYSLDGGATWTEVGAIINAFDAVKGQTVDAIIEALADSTIMPWGAMSGAQCNILLRSSTAGTDVYTLTRSSGTTDGWYVSNGKTLTITNIVLDGGSHAGLRLFYVQGDGTLCLETGAVITSSHTDDSAGMAILNDGDVYFEGGVVRGWRESQYPPVQISTKGTVYIHAGGIENCTQTSTSVGMPSAIGGVNTSYFEDDATKIQRTVLYMTGGFIRNNTHTGVGTAVRGAISFNRAPLVEISGGEISGNVGADEYSCGVFMGNADWGKKGVVRISGNPVITGNTTVSGASCDVYVEESSRFVQIGNLTSGANVGVYSTGNYTEDSTFGTLSSAGFTGVEYIHNDRDATLVGSADGTNLKWTTGSEDPEEPEEPEEPLPIYTLTIPAQDHLTVASVKTNNVTVTGSGNDYLVVSNTQVTINFTAASGYQITGGNPVVVTVESNMTLAQFPTVQQASTPDTPVWPDYVPCTPSNRYTIEGAIPVVKQLYTEQLNSLNDARFPLPREFDLVTIGDSITDNWDTRDNANYFALAGENGAVFNLGIGGDRIEQLLWRLEEGGCNNFKAKYITLLIGTNNSYQRRMEEGVDPDRPEEMAKGIERVLWNLTTGHPEAKILLMPILPYEKLHDERGAVCRANNENVNDLIIKFVDNKQIFWLDIRGGFLNADGSFHDDYWSASGEAGSDGKGHYLHPSSAGYSQVFDPAVRAAMTKIDASVSADTAQETDPSLGYASASVDSWNSQVTMTLSGVYVGTDSSAVKASSYKIEYKFDDGGWTTACENQTLTRNTFVIENVAIGQHTCEIKVTTSAGKSVTTVSQFTMSDAWMAEALGATSASVRTEGDLVYAYAADGNYTVAGVTFTKASGSVDDSNIKWPFSLTAGSTKPDGLESGGYADLLTHCWWMNPGTGGKQETITLKGLTPGNEYLVQLFAYRSSNNDGFVYVVGTQADTTFIRAGGDGWPYGGTLVGKFTADATTKDIVIQIEGVTALNGIQVRSLGEGGDDPESPSYAVSWTGGANASVDARVDGAAISSGAEVEDGKSVVFTVAPNTNYEFAEASHTDWMKSGETLTRAVTVDGAAVSITIPNATEKTTPPGPTPEHTSGPMSASGDTLCTDGDLLYAYSILGGEVSGVSFVRTIPISGGANVAFSEVVDGSKFGDFGNEGDWSQYGNILSHASYWSSADSLTVELKSLTAGRKYLVQFVVHNSSADGGMTVSINSGAAQYVNGKTQSDYKYGASLVYEFTAVAATEEVELTYSGSGDRVVNAIQVRVLPGDEPTPTTYAVSWTGGANATVDVKANGSAIDSGALVGDGTNVVFTVTPNSGYEFAEASYQDWTKSGDALTRTVTVNGAAVNIEIPNATKKDIPVVVYGWKAEHLGTSETAIYTVGTKKYAYCSTQFGSLTVNTVPFDQKSDFPSGMSISVSNGQFFRCIDAITLPSGVASDSDYGKLLTSGYWGPNLSGNNDIVITFNGLVEGKDYLVQLISHSTLSGRNGQITVGGKTIDPAWDFGGSLVGVFKAEGSSQAFTFTFSDKSFINGLQVRELAEGEGAGIIDGGDDPTTYEVSWTGGANATVDAKANGSAINSGALVGDGTNVVFTVTPNTNYEFAEASYQDWTLTEGVLTRTVTVNGAAVDVTIPNATAKSGPTPVEGDWYVSQDGDDSNNGKSADTPYATIAKAVSSAANGDVICVLAGNYTVTSVIDVSKAITIKGEGWDKTIVNGGSNRMFALKNAAAKLEGMKLTGATANTRGAAVHMTDGTISWCYISGNTRSGTDYKGGAVSILKGTIDHSVFADNTSTMSGAAIGGSNPNGDILIDTCLVYGNGMASGSSGSGGIDFDNLNNVTCTIRNCTVVDNTSFGDFPAGIRVTGTGKAILINNIISGNIRDNSGKSELNLAVTKSLLDTTASRNCIITGTKDTDATYYRDAGAVSVISGSSAVVPTFVNAASGDYHLAEGSSAIAAGVTYTGIGVDLDGAAFAATPSAGCYEYSGDVPPAPATYEVSWTGGANATVDAKANGSAINSGALVGDGTNVVFTVTPNSGYEFASASDGWTLSSGNLTKTFTVNGSALSIAVPNATKKADPPHELDWTAAKMTADPASIRKDGVLCYAYACGGDYIVNDVEFVKILNSDRVDGNQDKPIDNANLRWEVTNATQGQDAPGTTGDYTGLLKHCWWWWSDAALTLRNLTPGHTYLVQVIGCRAGHDDTAQTSVAVVEAGDNSIFMKAAGDGWECGGTLVGTFEASDTTQTFHFEKITGSWSAFNAIQVRDLSLTDDDAVAIIERGSMTNYFFTIEDAYNGATEGETIKLVKDAGFPANDPVFSKGVDLDLNGYVMTRSNLKHEKVISSDTVITNGVLAFDSGVYSSDTGLPFRVQSGATLTLDTMNVGDANGHEPLCLMIVEDGSHVVLSGEGTYHAGSLFQSVDSDNTMTITGGRYILRGWFMPADKVYLFADYKKGKVSISGGSFSIAPDKDWIASGYVILHDVTDRETPYHVVPAAEAPYTEPGWSYYYKDAAAAEAAHVAKRETAGGVKYYTSLRDAVSAANGSGTVTLVADIPSLDRGVTLGGTVTLDGAGHKVSVAHPYVNDSGFVANDFSFNIINMISVYPKEADVTLRNISLTGGGLLDGELGNNGLSVIDNQGTLLMENVTVTRSNGAVYNEQTGVLYMDNCRLVRNCRYCAGGLFNVTGGFAVMNRSSLSENRSLGVAGGGGACENGGTLFVNNCVIVNNSSTEVGGAINNYGSNHMPKLYMMNTTVSGNFSSIYDDTNAFEHDKGGAIGMRGEADAEFFAVNSLFSCNYQTDTRTGVEWGPIMVSDMCSIDGGTAVKLYYSVYTGLRSKTPENTETTVVRFINEDESSTNVFNAYFASPRVYQNAQPTAMAINGAQLISKDDGSMDAALARYAPILRIDNGDGTYDYGQAVYGTDGVYTYFDPSNWKSKSVAMSYAPVDTSKGAVDFFNYEAAGAMQAIAELPTADPAYMVTNYYESASGRSFGVAGASGWLKGDVTYYTVKLVAEPENGTVSGVTVNGESYEEGTVIQLTATPGYARDFLGWYEITDGGATTNFLSDSNKTVWELTVDHNYELLAKFSDLQEVLTPDPYVHVKMADDTDGPLLYPITMMTKWMREHYEDFEDTLAGMTKAEAEAWLTEILERTSPGTGRKMWQDYVLGVDPNDANAKIWINSPQYMSTGKNLIRMEMNKLSPVSGTKFTINYRLDKKLDDATTFARADVNETGSYDVKVENDPSGLYVIDLLFIPEGKATSEEYVTTVNTAGVLKVDNHAWRAAVAAPWMKLQPTGSSAVSAVDLVKTMNLTPEDVLYLYDSAEKDYRAWKMNENGGWSPLDVITMDEHGVLGWTNREEIVDVDSQIARGLGLWLERASTNGCIYLAGQYDPAGVDTTELQSGWNLVGNPLPVEYDLTKLLNENTAKGVRLVVPTAGTPKEYEYREGKGWGYSKSVKVTKFNKELVQTTFVTDDFRLPAGCAFWYYPDPDAPDDPPTLQWNGEEVAE